MHRKSGHSSTVDFYPVEWPERVELRQSMSDTAETNFGNCQVRSRVLQFSVATLSRFGNLHRAAVALVEQSQ